MAKTMTARRNVFCCRGTADRTLPAPFATIARLAAGATSAARRFTGIIAAYLPWSRRPVPGSETVLGMWDALGEEPPTRRHDRRSRAGF